MVSSKKWRVQFCNYEGTSINFKLQLYKTDEILNQDSIEQTDGKCFTHNTDLKINKTFQVSNIQNINDIDLIDNNTYSNQTLQIINNNDLINIDYVFENEITTGSMKLAFKLIDNFKIPNVIKVYYYNGNDYVLDQECQINSLLDKIQTHQINNNMYISFECISTNDDFKWVLTKSKFFTL